MEESSQHSGTGSTPEEEPRVSRGGRAVQRVFPPLLSEAAWQRVTQRYELTDRECDVLKCICAGYSYEAACQELQIARPTLRTHLRSAYRKLAVNSQVQLILHLLHEHRPTKPGV